MMETELKESWAVVVCKCNEIDRKDALEKWFSGDVYDEFEKCLLRVCHQNEQDLHDEVFLHPNSRAIDLIGLWGWHRMHEGDTTPYIRPAHKHVIRPIFEYTHFAFCILSTSEW